MPETFPMLLSMSTSDQRSALARTLQQARDEVGLSQKGLGTLMGVDERSIRNWEAGKGLDQRKLARALDRIRWFASGGSLEMVPNAILFAEVARRLADVVDRSRSDDDEDPVSLVSDADDRNASGAAQRRKPVQGKPGPPIQKRRLRDDAHSEDDPI